MIRRNRIRRPAIGNRNWIPAENVRPASGFKGFPVF